MHPLSNVPWRATFAIAFVVIACADITGLSAFEPLPCADLCLDGGADATRLTPGPSPDADARATGPNRSDAPRGPEPLKCPDEVCASPDVCCLRGDGAGASCAGDCASDGASAITVSCLRDAECGAGEVCCAFVGVQTASRALSCAPLGSCGNRVCAAGTTCGDGQACESLDALARIKRCEVQDARVRVTGWFRDVLGREPDGEEVARYEASFQSLLGLGDLDAIHASIAASLVTYAESHELGDVVARAIASAHPKPATEVDVDGHELPAYLEDKVRGRFGKPLPASFGEMTAFIQERTPRVERALGSILWQTYGSLAGAIAGPGAASVFHRDLMEDPADAAAIEKLTLGLNRSLLASSALLERVLDRAIEEGKAANVRAPRLDDGVAFPEDRAFFRTDVGVGDGALKTGIFGWTFGRIKDSSTASRADVLGMYDAVSGCNKARAPSPPGPCPPAGALAWWTAEFYDGGHQTYDYSRAAMARKTEQHLEGCAKAGQTIDCSGELRELLARACSSASKGCERDEALKTDVVAKVASGKLDANWNSIECYVRHDRVVDRDPLKCRFSWRSS